LGIVYALKKFHYYLWGCTFTLSTDHRPLTYIQHQSDLPATIANWTETILRHHFECVYRPGLLNIIPDALSRAFPEDLWSSASSSHSDTTEPCSKRHKSAATIKQKNRCKLDPTDLSPPIPSISSQELAAHITASQVDPLAPYVHQLQTADVQKSIPDDKDRNNLLKTAHGQAYLGANAMVNALHLQGITWPKLKEACLQHNRQCTSCQYYNIAKEKVTILLRLYMPLFLENILLWISRDFPKVTTTNTLSSLLMFVLVLFSSAPSNPRMQLSLLRNSLIYSAILVLLKLSKVIMDPSFPTPNLMLFLLFSTLNITYLPHTIPEAMVWLNGLFDLLKISSLKF